MMQPKMFNQTNVNIDKWNRINLNLDTFRNSPKNKYSYDAFGNAIGNSLVIASQSGNTSTTNRGNTADPLASIGQSISDNVGSSVNASINANAAKISGEVERLGAANLTVVANAQQAQNNAEFAANLNFAERGMANLAGLNHDLALKQASVASSQANIAVLSQRLSRITDGYQTPKDIEMAHLAELIAAKQGQPRRYASGLTPERYADIQGVLNSGSEQVTGTPLVPVGSYSGLVPQNGNPSFEFGVLGGVSLPFAHGGVEASLAIDPNGDTYFNLSGFGGLDAQYDWTEWNGNTGFSALRTFDGSAKDLITGKSIQHTLTLDAIDFGATSLDFSLALGETIPDSGKLPVHFEGFESGLNIGKRGFLKGFQGITDQMSPLMRNGNYSTSLEIAPQEALYKTNFGVDAYEFAQSTFSTLDDIYKGAAGATKLIFQSPGSFAAPVGVNPYYIQTHTQYQSQIQQLLKGGK